MNDGVMVVLQQSKDHWQRRLDEARRVAAAAEKEIALATKKLGELTDEIAGLRLAAAAELLETGAAQ